MEVPAQYTTAGITMLLSGVFNIVTGLMLFMTLIWACVGVLWLIPIGIGVWEIVTGVQMLQGTPQPAAKTVSIAGLVSGVLNCNPLPIGLEVASLAMLSNPETAGFIEGGGSGGKLY